MICLMWILFCQMSVCQRRKYSKSVKCQKWTFPETACPIYHGYSLIKWHPVIEKDIVSIKRL